jgi:hypothetical protein
MLLSDAEPTSSRTFVLFLEPWGQVTGTRAEFLERRAAKELAPDHALYQKLRAAVAITGASDDVLFELADGRFAQVHLTYTKTPPERPGFPRYRIFETLYDWMTEVMIEDHVEHSGLW